MENMTKTTDTPELRGWGIDEQSFAIIKSNGFRFTATLNKRDTAALGRELLARAERMTD